MNIIQRIVPESANHPLRNAAPPVTLVLHTNGAKNSVPSLYNYIINSGTHIYPHFQIAKDGTIEQYVPLERQSYAEYDGNSYAFSVETQDSGYASGVLIDNDPWTDAQLLALADLARFLKVPARACITSTSGGLGYHSQFPVEWNRDGHNCPGKARISQIQRILAYMTPVPPPVGDDMPTKLVRKKSTGEIAMFDNGRLKHITDMVVLGELQKAGLVEATWVELSDAAYDNLASG